MVASRGGGGGGGGGRGRAGRVRPLIHSFLVSLFIVLFFSFCFRRLLLLLLLFLLLLHSSTVAFQVPRSIVASKLVVSFQVSGRPPRPGVEICPV